MRKVCLIKNTLKCCDMPSVYSLLEQDISNSQWNKLLNGSVLKTHEVSVSVCGYRFCP